MFFFFFFFSGWIAFIYLFWPRCVACGILFPRLWMEHFQGLGRGLPPPRSLSSFPQQEVPLTCHKTQAKPSSGTYISSLGLELLLYISSPL